MLISNPQLRMASRTYRTCDTLFPFGGACHSRLAFETSGLIFVGEGAIYYGNHLSGWGSLCYHNVFSQHRVTRRPGAGVSKGWDSAIWRAGPTTGLTDGGWPASWFRIAWNGRRPIINAGRKGFLPTGS
jgi:hypothetical protein